MAIDVDALYRRHGPMVLRRCRRLLATEDQAVDAMHDVFVELLRRRARLEDRGLSSLLFVMATRICLNKIRGTRKTEGDELLHDIACLDDPLGRSELRMVLDRIFRGEPPSTRVIAVLHHIDGMTHEEVAREVGLSVSGVRKRLRTLKHRSLPLMVSP